MRIAFIALLAALAAQDQKPVFKSGVDLILVDAHVVDKNGEPILDLTPEDFEVQISGRARRVVSAEVLSYTAAPPAAPPVPGVPSPATTAAPRPRRMFVLAVDEHSLHAANAFAAVRAAERFIDKLEPDDLVGLYAYPTGVAQHDMTSDHASVRRMLRKIAGLFVEPASRFNLSPSEIVDIAGGDRDALGKVIKRACPGGPTMGCTAGDIQREAISLVGFMEMQVAQSVRSLQGLVRALGEIPGRKLLVLVSGGLNSSTNAMGRANASAEIRDLGRETAKANVAMFALHLDWSFLQALSSRSGLRLSYFSDSNMAANGLEMVAGTSGGTVFRVHGTSPDIAFDRVLRETSAYYLVGVEGRAEDRDGQPHAIRVKVKRRGAQVRSRTELVIPKR
jgi:VWFA-related protein